MAVAQLTAGVTLADRDTTYGIRLQNATTGITICD